MSASTSGNDSDVWIGLILGIVLSLPIWAIVFAALGGLS